MQPAKQAGRRYRMPSWTASIAGVLLAFGLASCGSSPTAPAAVGAGSPSTAAPSTAAPSATAPATNLSLVALGDSLPFALSSDCGGCVGFPTLYGKALQKATKKPVDVINDSLHNGLNSAGLVA